MSKIVKSQGAFPEKFEYLRGGCFINILPALVPAKEEGEVSTTYEYYQMFVQETNPDKLNLLEKEMRNMLYGSITRRQARLQLLAMNLLDDVEAKINENRVYEIEWSSANTIERNSPLIDIVASELGLTEEQVDEIFLHASKL